MTIGFLSDLSLHKYSKKISCDVKHHSSESKD